MIALAVAGCGGSDSNAPAGSPTPATLVGTYRLESYDGQHMIAKTYGVASGTLTLRADSTYSIVLTATPVGVTPAGWQWTFNEGKWSYMGHYFGEDVLFLRPSAPNMPTWNGAILNGGLSFSGNGYPDVFFLPNAGVSALTGS